MRASTLCLAGTTLRHVAIIVDLRAIAQRPCFEAFALKRGHKEGLDFAAARVQFPGLKCLPKRGAQFACLNFDRAAEQESGILNVRA